MAAPLAVLTTGGAEGLDVLPVIEAEGLLPLHETPAPMSNTSAQPEKAR